MKKLHFRQKILYYLPDLAPCPALPGSARPCPGQRRLGAGIQGIPPHVPMSQYIVNLAERKLPQTTTTTTTYYHHYCYYYYYQHCYYFYYYYSFRLRDPR